MNMKQALIKHWGLSYGATSIQKRTLTYGG